MALPDIFSQAETDKLLLRIDQLRPDTHPQWGKMNVAQMLAHCNVTYEMAIDNRHTPPNALMRFILKMMVKNKVVGGAPYAKGSPTAPQFLVAANQDFATEQRRLKNYLQQTVQLGAAHFDGKKSHSFGPLNRMEWNNMFYKHLDHHLTQFGV